MQTIYNVGVYARLSREDERESESASIENQKEILTRHVREQGWNLFNVYVDDGHSGTSFVQYIVDTALELQSRESSSLSLLMQQLEETTKAINNMLNAIQQGVLTSSTKQRLDELEETKSKLEINILQEQMQKPLLTREQLTFWICRFRNTDITKQDQRQRLIDIFINSVYIFDDHAVITFNYRDGTKTISLKEIEAVGLDSSLSGFGAPVGVFLQDFLSCEGIFASIKFIIFAVRFFGVVIIKFIF